MKELGYGATGPRHQQRLECDDRNKSADGVVDDRFPAQKGRGALARLDCLRRGMMTVGAGDDKDTAQNHTADRERQPRDVVCDGRVENPS